MVLVGGGDGGDGGGGGGGGEGEPRGWQWLARRLVVHILAK